MTRRTVRFVVPALASLGMIACAVLCQGCYERVVAARGLGAGAYNVSEPYQENSRLDDWVFGERKASSDKIVRAKPQPE